MLLELTLTQDNDVFGPEGTKIMVNDSYVVGVAPNGSGTKVFLDMSDLEPFITVYVKEAYSKWYILRLNP